MTKKVCVILAVFALAGCSPKIENNPAVNTNQTASSTENSVRPEKLKEKNSTEIYQSQFYPNTYIIKPGTTIKWFNRENTPISSAPRAIFSPRC